MDEQKLQSKPKFIPVFAVEDTSDYNSGAPANPDVNSDQSEHSAADMAIGVVIGATACFIACLVIFGATEYQNNAAIARAELADNAALQRENRSQAETLSKIREVLACN